VRALLQRVTSASVRVDGIEVARIAEGLLVFVGCVQEDGLAQAVQIATKIARYRVFADEDGKTNLSVQDISGQLLVVPQFTLAAETKKGNRPSFSRALAPEQAFDLVSTLCAKLREEGISVSEGVFGAEMSVELVNQGPASYLLEVV